MSKNIVSPCSVSFEDALRNLASRLTGRPATELPRTQEGIVQFMAENVPTPDEMTETITQKILTRLEATAAPAGEEPGQKLSAKEEPEIPNAGQQEAPGGIDSSEGTPIPEEGEEPNGEAPVSADKPKRGRSKTVK
ncbi:MAG: hypothetical protein K2M42_07480 [Oscillospiraceae bacterium]|nr:hypothetical protein [Oscillospiraceae bacterium]